MHPTFLLPSPHPLYFILVKNLLYLPSMRLFPTKTSARNSFVPFARFALFVIYVWFGTLKIIDVSSAEPLVHQLKNVTLPFISFEMFYQFFAGFEILIGLLFLIPRFTKFACTLLLIHLFTTILPLIFLPESTWQSLMIPTLIGQYIIKNLVILATGWGIYAHE